MAKVRVIGLQPVSSVTKRNPASARKAQTQEASPGVKSSEFLESYQAQQAAQPKNPQEVQRLIDDLKSY